EWSTGFERLMNYSNPLPPSLQEFKDFIASCSKGTSSLLYPGSPRIAQEVLRPIDKKVCFELHPADAELLTMQFGKQKNMIIRQEDGLKNLKSLLPPPSRRGCIFIDPSYELVRDYEAVPEAIADALTRFSTGVYIIWYPLLHRKEATALPDRILELYSGNRCNIELQIGPETERGMFGSGLVVINPPWILKDIIETSLPTLQEMLGTSESLPAAPKFQAKNSQYRSRCNFYIS
ncbi:MAG: 23S rRNA (adenine(2030)-N(6))-methyltransferase RlmJ, partial [Termitinemataceae bacterium]